MDTKEHWLIEEALATITSGSFSEQDVLALLILLRRHCPPRTPVREFGDFVAHREKDRGILQEFLNRVQLRFHDREPADVEPPRLPVFTAEEIEQSLNDVLERNGFATVDREVANRIIVSIISLLQYVQVETELGSPVRGFAVGISTSQVALLGHGTVPPRLHVFQFPLLIANNNGYEFSLAHPDAPKVDLFMPFDGLVQTYSSKGEFRIEQCRAA